MERYYHLVIVSYVVGLGIEMLFSQCKNTDHEVEEGYLVTGMLVPLIVPVDIPLMDAWQLQLYLELFLEKKSLEEQE